MTAAEQARDQVLEAVGVAHPTSLDLALRVIAKWAATGQPFSANDTRADMDRECVPTPVRGNAFLLARRRRLIRAVGHEKSSDVDTHSKPVARYVAASTPEPPQGRSPRGRFTPPVHEDQQALAL